MKIIILILALLSGVSNVEDCKPVKCPDNLKGNTDFGRQLPCYLSVMDLGDMKAPSKTCKFCNSLITSNKDTWIHITFVKFNGGYRRCADHLAGYVCENPSTLTNADPK